jgi:dimeric dUTPase (all-alpha-NTP-PPase superfamily)
MRKYTVSEMLELQDDLNSNTDPYWKTNRSISQFEMAIMAECVELMESGRKWKWWKFSDGIADDWNEKIEIIDIVHFYLSKILLHPSLHRMQTDLFVGFNFPNQDGPSLISTTGEFAPEPFMRAVRLLIDGYGGTTANLDLFVKAANMTTEEVSALYIAKNTLNNIRQGQGYQDGAYIKNRGGIEDNVRLMPIIDAFMITPTMGLADIKRSVEEEFLIN